MARKPTDGTRPSRRAKKRRTARRSVPLDDTAMQSLSKEEIARLSMDSWEPSLLRHMLEAENKLRGG